MNFKYDFLLVLFCIFLGLTASGFGISRYFTLIAMIPFFTYIFLFNFKKEISKFDFIKSIILTILLIVIAVYFDSSWVDIYSYKLMFSIIAIWSLFYIIYFVLCFIIVIKFRTNNKFTPFKLSLFFGFLYMFYSFLVEKFIHALFVTNWINALFDLGFLIYYLGISIPLFLLVFSQSLVGYLIAKLISTKFNFKELFDFKKNIKYFIGVFILIFFILIILSNNYFAHKIDNNNNNKFHYSNNSDLTIAMIQGNIGYGMTFQENNPWTPFEIYYNYSLEIIEKKTPDIIMWPEYSVPYPILENQNMLNNLYFISSKYNITFLIGNKGRVVFNSSEFTSNDPYYDMILVIFPNETYQTFYQKLLPPENVNKIPEEYNLSIVDIYGKKFAIFICWESSDINLIKKYKYKDFDYILFFDSNRKLEQITRAYDIASFMHKYTASYLGKKGFRVTTTGISDVVNENGIVLKELYPFKQGILVYTINK